METQRTTQNFLRAHFEHLLNERKFNQSAWVGIVIKLSYGIVGVNNGRGQN